MFGTQPPGPGRSWSEEQLAGRELLLIGGDTAVEYPREAKADVLLTQDGTDATYAKTLMEHLEMRPWCLGLEIFDAALLFGRGLPG